MSDPMSNTLASPGLNKSLGAYAVFMALNIVGVQIAATFELVVTLLAIFELLVFMSVVAPGFSIANFAHNGWAGADAFSLGSIGGMVAAIPFAILFFLAIEGVAMGAEEARDPKRSIPIAYIGGILTLVVLAAGVMVFAGGAGDWTRLANINDPLPQAMKMIVGEASGWLHMLVWLGVIGILAIFSDQLVSFGGQTLTANIVTMAVFGAIVMYIVSMASLFRLRRTEVALARPYRAPMYPLLPAFALVAAAICLVTMIWFNLLIFCLFAVLGAIGYGYFLATGSRRSGALSAAMAATAATAR